LSPLVRAHPPFVRALIRRKLHLMRGAYAVIFGLAVGLVGTGATFFASGRADSQGWTWLSDLAGPVRWQFFALPRESQWLSVEILMQTRDWRTPPPSSLPVTTRFSTFSSSRTRRLLLQRVGKKGGYVSYFGQVILARRELDLGSYLSVELLGWPAGVTIGVHEDSVRIRGEEIAFAEFTGGGAGGPLAPLPSDPQPLSILSPNLQEQRAPSEGRTIRECTGMEDAPYLSPGRYMGTLGWPGPGQALYSRDWFRVNLWPGYLLEVRINSPRAIRLGILNPSGQEVGWVEGSGQVGIVYQALQAGTYWVCVSIAESTPLFTYTLDFSISR